MLERNVLSIHMRAKWVNLATHETEPAVQAPRRILVFDDFEIDRADIALARPIERGRDELTPHTTPTMRGIEPEALSRGCRCCA